MNVSSPGSTISMLSSSFRFANETSQFVLQTVYILVVWIVGNASYDLNENIGPLTLVVSSTISSIGYSPSFPVSLIYSKLLNSAF